MTLHHSSFTLLQGGYIYMTDSLKQIKRYARVYEKRISCQWFEIQEKTNNDLNVIYRGHDLLYWKERYILIMNVIHSFQNIIKHCEEEEKRNAKNESKDND